MLSLKFFRTKSKQKNRFLIVSLLTVAIGIFLSWFLAGMISYRVFPDFYNTHMAFFSQAGAGESGDVLAKTLQGDFSPEAVEKGKELMAFYGFSDRETYYLLPGFSQLRFLLFAVGSLFCIFTGSIIIFTGLRQFKHLSGEISSLSSEAKEYIQSVLQDESSRSVSESVLENRKKYDESDVAALYRSIEDLSSVSGRRVQSLDKQRKYMQEYLSDISHQIRTPVSSLQLYHELMLKEPDMPLSERTRFQELGLEQIQRISWLIEGLLQLARLEADVVSFVKNDTSLKDTVESAVKPYTEIAKQKGISIELDVPEQIHFLHDAAWLSEAIGNLVKNAIEHTPGNLAVDSTLNNIPTRGEVCIRAEQTPISIQLFISDNGVGIDEKEQTLIFKRFYRADSQLKPGGVGIGLSLAKAIIEKNDGDLFVKSIKGKGTTFTAAFLL